MDSREGGPPPNPLFELEMGIMFAAIAIIALVTLGVNWDWSIFF